jgi:plastocyanin
MISFVTVICISSVKQLVIASDQMNDAFKSTNHRLACLNDGIHAPPGGSTMNDAFKSTNHRLACLNEYSIGHDTHASSPHYKIKYIGIIPGAFNTTIAHFVPSIVWIAQGSTIIWINNDKVNHHIYVNNITSQNLPLFTSDKNLNPYGDTFNITFNKKGIYQYYCSLHPFMKGTVHVI